MTKFVSLLIPSVFLLSIVLILYYSVESVTGLLPSSESSEQFEPKIPRSGETIREPSKSSSIQRTLPDLEFNPPSKLAPLPLDIPYKVTIKFDSITIRNTHDPGFISPQGDGEYDLAVYVQGKKIDLTGASVNCLYAGVDFPPCGLGHADLRETIYFNKPGYERAEIVVDIPKTMPLSIFSVGHEVDECGRVPFPTNIDNFDSILRASQQERDSAITNIQKNLNSYDCNSKLENDNEILGTITKFYYPPGQSYELIGYGAGSHTNVISSTRDFILRYTISVVAPPLPPKPVKQCGETNLPIKSVTDNGNDGNVSSNVLDNNYDTRWSNKGTGTLLNVDLGTKRGVCHIEISWYGSNFRAYISASPDGVGWTLKAKGQTPALSPSVTGDIRYSFPYAEVRYIRVNIYDNAPEDVVGIRELNVYG